MNRRELMNKAASVAGVTAFASMARTASAAQEGDKKPSIRFRNEDFYSADNEFDVEKAKDAIVRLCRYHRYPLFPGFRQNLWVSDYGAGHFTDMGLAAYLFVNNVEDRYMMLDIYLLPNQMLPEHWHIEGEGNPAKREGWLVRWGLSHIVGIGEPNLGSDVVVPKCHWGGKVTTKHEVIAKPGMFVPLAEPGTPHWQLAGPEGAIITEVANVHTNSAVRHSDPKANEYFLSE
jgi:hypothetical protein